MRKLFPMLAVAGLFVCATFTVVAADDKEKTITGGATCAKCALKETKDCQNVVLVKEGDKETKYYMSMKNAVAKENHGKGGFCKSEKKVKVVGVVSEKDGKMFIEPTAITVVEE
jgi:hypothetical protein